MFVKKVTKPSKAELSARYGGLSGSVLLIARAAADTAVYYWQWSLDQQTWTSVPPVMRARVVIAGLSSPQTAAILPCGLYLAWLGWRWRLPGRLEAWLAGLGMALSSLLVVLNAARLARDLPSLPGSHSAPLPTAALPARPDITAGGTSQPPLDLSKTPLEPV